MITRIWHGWTTQRNADAYETLLRTEILAGVGTRAIPGYRGIELLHRNVADEVEFATIMRFDSIDAVRTFAGPSVVTTTQVGRLTPPSVTNAASRRTRVARPTNWSQLLRRNDRSNRASEGLVVAWVILDSGFIVRTDTGTLGTRRAA